MKGQIANAFGVVAHTDCSRHSALLLHTDGRGCVPIRLDLQRQQAGWIWPKGRGLPAPDLC